MSKIVKLKDIVAISPEKVLELYNNGYRLANSREEENNAININTAMASLPQTQLLQTSNIKSLATCPSSKTIQAVINPVATGSGGALPYTFKFKVDGVVKQTIVGLATQTSATFTPYTIIETAEAPHTYSTEIIDSCAVPQTKVDICTINIVSPLTTTLTGCPAAALTDPGSVSLTLAAAGGTIPYTYAWTLNGIAVGTLSTYSKANLAVGVHTIIGTVTDAISRTSSKTCIVNVACVPLSATMVIT